jgi:undecaprenyl-diphosphatase
MTDTSVFYFINGLAGHIRILDELIKGLSNDYFALLVGCLILVWLWFGTREPSRRLFNQRTVLSAMMSIGIACIFMVIINHFYYRPRPFDVLPADSINLLFYKPHDSSFPSNLTAIVFALAAAVFIRNRKWGGWLLALACIASIGRVYMGVHYPLDILGGAAVGVLSGFIAEGLSRVFKTWIGKLLYYIQRIYLA